MFKDRKDAGKRLASQLKKYKRVKDTMVLGLPRGGVVVAAEIARDLKLPLDVLVIRKIGAPLSQELAIGATDDAGHRILNESVIESLQIPQGYVEEESAKQKERAMHQLQKFRGDKPPLDLKDKTAILVDDGLATGATMKAAIFSARSKGAKKVVVAVPVGAPDSLENIQKETDEIFYVEAPVYFAAVGSFYENFEQTTDDEVITLLEQ